MRDESKDTHNKVKVTLQPLSKCTHGSACRRCWKNIMHACCCNTIGAQTSTLTTSTSVRLLAVCTVNMLLQCYDTWPRHRCACLLPACHADCWLAVAAANRCLSLPAARVKLACVGKSESVSVAAAAEVRGFHLEARRALPVLARLQQQQQ